MNPHAAGPFCRFRIGSLPTSSGVYAIVVGEDLKYIGRCENLARRFGPADYGVIHARKLHRDGQATNCKINSRVLSEAKVGRAVSLFFHESTDRFVEIEAELIALLSPPWNQRRESITRSSKSGENAKAAALSRRDGARKRRFSVALDDEFREATALGRSFVRINARELHRKVGRYPGPNHACRRVARQCAMPRVIRTVSSMRRQRATALVSRSNIGCPGYARNREEPGPSDG